MANHKGKEIQAITQELNIVPDYLQREKGVPAAGLENVQREDITVPRLALTQSMTPQRKKSDPKYIDGLEEGDFFNTITGENYGAAVKLVPLFFYKTRILFKDIEEGGGMLCQAQDGVTGVGDPGGDCATCPKSQFGDNGRPDCNHFYNYAVLVVPKKGSIGLDSLAAFSLKSSGIKTAKDWNALMRLKGTDSFAGVYEVTSAEQKNTAGQTWSTAVIKNAGWVSKDEYTVAQACYQSVREMQSQGRLKVDAEDLGTREPGDEA